MIMCDLKCKFVISAERMQEITMDMNKERYEKYKPITEEESLEALSNLGRENLDEDNIGIENML